ncbi:Carboxylesterase NlhH [Nonomuraea coxensis DSM 45129]|uniref:Carboxylesterase NlhH n=1 Tax=Nonomuraea coxensis DSM 45129 TaxID=1122611 RepID=A0ABX8U6G1_9ACTN|nr:alpha/beta hydrolase [Nonomuraea coxensis]QYC42329.1 Carboxylesterase NlhH [Nonomuraea coxensis DSM 45129]
MALDEATTQFLLQMGDTGVKPLHEMTPGEARLTFAALRDLYGPGPEMLRVEEAVIGGEDGGSFGARVLVPSATPRGVLVYYHGGGWVIGGLDEFDTLGRQLAARTGCTVALVDYRLAPEHRYPTAARDAYAALTWTAATYPGLPIMVAGDSAGGNLAAVAARRARDEGGPEILLQVLVYPVTDCDLDNASYTDPANQLMLSRDSMVWFWDHYAPDPADRVNPDASPLRAADLSGLPPAVVLTAEHDVLRDEGEAYAERLRAAGVPVESRRFEGQMHAFFTLVNVLPGSAEAVTMVSEAINGRLA